MSELSDLVVLFSTRSILSLIGIFFIVAFSWQWDRKWDQEGPQSIGDTEVNSDSSAVDKDGAEYDAMDEGTAGPPRTGETAEHTRVRPLSNFPQRIPLSFVGWGLLAVSNLLPRKAWIGIQLDILNLASSVILLLLGFIQSTKIPSAIVQRQYTNEKGLWETAMVGGMFLEGVIMYMSDTHTPVFAAPLGGLIAALAPTVLWRNRLVGDTYDSEGRLNPRPILYNFGGPLIIFGWFWFWIGMNCCSYYPGKWEAYVYIYSGLRMLLSFVGGISIIFTTWVIGYGLDELENLSGQSETASGLLSASAFGMNGYFCGYVYEIKVASIISWAPLGLAAFFPFDWEDYMEWFLLIATAATGYSMAMIQEEGLRMLDVEKIDLWLNRLYICIAAVAILIPIQHGSHYFAFILSAVGAACFGIGLHFLLTDQKRSKQWILTERVQKPHVYSYGALLSPLGALILSWAVTMHPN